MDKILRRLLIITPALLLIPTLLIAGCSCDSQSPSIATIGEPAPDFTLPDLDGESVSLSDLKGSPVVINFWNTGCTYCIKEMPYLEEVYEENQDSGLVLLTINIGQTASTAEDFLNNNNIDLPVLLDSDGAVTQRYGMPGIPTTFFIDKDGILRAKVIGSFPTKEAIDRRLSEIMS
jgi:cytochrome c biogenesis protein CcmG/thiol:disulfide interchange protein DsbE